MKITKSSLFNIEHTPLIIYNVLNEKTFYDIKLVFTYDEAKAHSEPHRIYITTEIMRKNKECNISNSISTQFKVFIEGSMKDHINQTNAWQIADMIQMAMSHSRVMFKNLCDVKGISVPFYKIEPIGVYYNGLLNGYYKLWN